MNVIANIFKAIFSFYLSFGIIGASFSILYLILDGISSSFFGANFNEFELHKPLLVIYLIAGLYLGFKMCSSIYHYSIIGFLKRDDAKYEQSLKENEIKAIVETAKDYDMFVAAHAHGIEGMQRAIKGGVRTIDHGTLMDKETAQLMKKYGTYYVPTVSAGEFVYEKAQKPGYFPEIIRPKALEIGPLIKKTLGMAYKEGVKIAFGTDTGVSPHGDNANEFKYMVEAGMSPIDALISANSIAADALGVNDIGQIKKGMKADIISIPGDPTKDISLVMKVDFVMKDGIVYKKN